MLNPSTRVVETGLYSSESRLVRLFIAIIIIANIGNAAKTSKNRSHSMAIKRTSFKVKRSKVKVTRLMLKPKVCRHTNYKLGKAFRACGINSVANY